MKNDKFSPWLIRWNLTPDGPSFVTPTSHLLPVKARKDGTRAMLKVTENVDEQTGNALMAWWVGRGAAQVLAHEGGAILLARASGSRSLAAMSRAGQDEAACRILCETANRLHALQKETPPPLPSLPVWFGALQRAAKEQGGILARCADIADRLLASPRDVTVLHGDLHHGNVLDFGDSGWLAIDPKGIIGERYFDFANIFTNPDLADPQPRVATLPEIFQRRLDVVTEAANLDRERLLQWIVAWCGLSTAWSLEDNLTNVTALSVAELAFAALGEQAS
ncbi:APH(6) family putative aminoglycoside O-phosphotransferase [Enterobacteriaceae bacterium 89]|nr:APH(6) family putative aminoglycoside O-phosphotransferase [Enterobacteriaceae bacterium 89]